MDGLTVLKSLYGSEKGFTTPSILLTAHDPDQYREEVESLGNVRFVEKPFEIDSLINTVRELLE
jgi:DNA-binding response OmpR family regulator